MIWVFFPIKAIQSDFANLMYLFLRFKLCCYWFSIVDTIFQNKAFSNLTYFNSIIAGDVYSCKQLAQIFRLILYKFGNHPLNQLYLVVSKVLSFQKICQSFHDCNIVLKISFRTRDLIFKLLNANSFIDWATMPVL